MDVGEDFLLKWNDHHSLFFKGAEKLLENEEFTDVILAAGERFFSAHRLVLSICSPFFQKLFKHLGNQKTVVYLKDIEAEHLELLLEYMYKGEIKVQESELVNVLSSAQSLEVKGLTDSGKNKKSKSATPPTSGIGAKRSAANSTVAESEVDSDVASSRKRANKNIKTTEKHVSPPPIKAIKQENNFTENDRASKTHRLSDSTSEDHGGVIATLANATSDYGDEDDAAVEGVEGGFDASGQYEELGYEDGEYFGEEGGIPPPPHLMATEEDRVSSMFSLSKNLKDKNTRCCFCNKDFKTKSLLDRHITVHTKEKKFVCRCGRGYTRADRLRKHEETCLELIPTMGHAFESDIYGFPAKSSMSADAGVSRDKTYLEDDLVVVADNDLLIPGTAPNKLEDLCAEEITEENYETRIIESDDEKIPSTPKPEKKTSQPGRRKVRKEVEKTYMNSRGFMVTKKEFVYESEDEPAEEPETKPLSAAKKSSR